LFLVDWEDYCYNIAHEERYYVTKDSIINTIFSQRTQRNTFYREGRKGRQFTAKDAKGIHFTAKGAKNNFTVSRQLSTHGVHENSISIGRQY
jgi:hypothetical protein